MEQSGKGREGRPEVALITGASRGIGRAAALALLPEVERFALVAQGEQGLEQVARELSSRGARVRVLAGDVSDEAFAARAFEEAERALGPVGILVNNAATLAVVPVAESSLQSWERQFDVNLKGAFLFSREAVRRMVPRRAGRIVGISSISATLGTPGLAAYCATKWGLNGLIKALAEELRGTGVLSLGVAPGSVDTELLRRTRFEPDMAPEDVARVIRFLALDAPSAMQGSIVEIFG